MALSPLAGKPAPKDLLIDLARLERDYHERRPDLADPNQRVAFGTSGHRGTPLRATFTEAHILAITQAICEYRQAHGIDGPVFMGKDTHAVSGPAQRTALEVLAANAVDTVLQRDDGVTPTPVISHAILVHNRGRRDRLADGIVITPSHNPPEDGGFKYNPPNGGPADTNVTGWIQERANTLLRAGNLDVQAVHFVDRPPVAARGAAERVHPELQAGGTNGVHVDDVPQVLDVEPDEVLLIRGPGLEGPGERETFHAYVARAQQFVGPVLHPLRLIGVGRAAVGRVVLEAAVLRWIVGRCHDDAVRKVIGARAVVDQDRM